MMRLPTPYCPLPINHPKISSCARALNFQRHFLWISVDIIIFFCSLLRWCGTHYFGVRGLLFFMPGHNFILLALRGNLLDLRGIKRQFLQLTNDAFSYFSLIYIDRLFPSTIFHGLWPNRHYTHFLCVLIKSGGLFIKFFGGKFIRQRAKINQQSPCP